MYHFEWRLRIAFQKLFYLAVEQINKNKFEQFIGDTKDAVPHPLSYKYKKRLLLRCVQHFKSDLINNVDHMRISGTEPSSVILSQTK